MPEPETDYDRVVDTNNIDGPPFGEIMSAAKALDSDERMLLVHSFEPVPLYDTLSQQGFDHETTQISEGEWHVEITPE